MLAFDTWIKKHHPELLAEFHKLPRAKKTQAFYHWVKDKYPDLILKEWPVVARLRARHLMREAGHE